MSFAPLWLVVLSLKLTNIIGLILKWIMAQILAN